MGPEHKAESVWKTLKIKAAPKREDRLVARSHDFIPGTPRIDAMRVIYDKNRVAGKMPSEPMGKVSPVAILYGDTPSGGARQNDKVHSAWGLCPTLTTLEMTVPVFDLETGWRRLTPRECARLQGFPDSFRLPEKNSVAYRQLGNAVCVEVVRRLGLAIRDSGALDA